MTLLSSNMHGCVLQILSLLAWVFAFSEQDSYFVKVTVFAGLPNVYNK